MIRGATFDRIGFRCLVLATAALATAACTAHRPDAPPTLDDIAQLRADIARIAGQHQTRDSSVIIVSHGQITTVLRPDQGPPDYALASLTKVFVAEAALASAARNEIDLDAPMNPGKPSPSWRHYLTHTSGNLHGETAWPPGLHAAYDNLNYVQLVQSLDQQASESWQQRSQRHGLSIDETETNGPLSGAIGLRATPEQLAEISIAWLHDRNAPTTAVPLHSFVTEGIETSRGLAPVGWRNAVIDNNGSLLALVAIGSNLGAGAEWRIYPRHNAAIIITTRSRYDPAFFRETIETLEAVLLRGDRTELKARTIPPHPIERGVYRAPDPPGTRIVLNVYEEADSGDQTLSVEYAREIRLMREIAPGYWLDRQASISRDADTNHPVFIDESDADLIVIAHPESIRTIGVYYRQTYFEKESAQTP